MSDSNHTLAMASFRRAVAVSGSQSAFARDTGASQQLISYRLKNDKPLPARFVLKAEASTGVSRHDLRPDIYPRDRGHLEGFRA